MITIPVTNGRAIWPVGLTERQAEELFAAYPEIARIDCPRCYYVRDYKRRRAQPVESSPLTERQLHVIEAALQYFGSDIGAGEALQAKGKDVSNKEIEGIRKTLFSL